MNYYVVLFRNGKPVGRLELYAGQRKLALSEIPANMMAEVENLIMCGAKTDDGDFVNPVLEPLIFLKKAYKTKLGYGFTASELGEYE